MSKERIKSGFSSLLLYCPASQNSNADALVLFSWFPYPPSKVRVGSRRGKRGVREGRVEG